MLLLGTDALLAANSSNCQRNFGTKGILLSGLSRAVLHWSTLQALTAHYLLRNQQFQSAYPSTALSQSLKKTPQTNLKTPKALDQT